MAEMTRPPFGIFLENVYCSEGITYLCEEQKKIVDSGGLHRPLVVGDGGRFVLVRTQAK